MSRLSEVCVRLSNNAYNDSAFKCGNEAFTIHKDGREIFIAFAGTDDLKDWQEDADIKTSIVKGLGVEVHHGFWNSMLQCWPTLIKMLKELYVIGDRIIITGHSKGGAMGLCLRLRLIQHGGFDIKDIYFYGFGTPRFLKSDSRSKYRKHFNSNVILHENEGDPICRLPRTYMGFTPVYSERVIANMPWYTRIYLIRAINHKIKTYLKNFG
jgi:hypothetical protein